MHIPLDYKGRHVFIFGGTTGINFGIARAFGRAGANVVVASRHDDNVNSAVAQLTGEGAIAMGVSADVRDFEAVGRALEQAVARFGPIDVLVSGAAGNFLCEAKAMSSNGFRTVVDIDLVGTFNVMRQGYQHLRRPGGSVVHITAPQSRVPMRYQLHCGAAKAGVDQITRMLALEWGAEGLRVNAISPGPIEGTEGFRKLMAPTPADHDAARADVPMKSFGTPDDIANLAMFLGSPYARYISGAVIPCDGGGAEESVKPALERAGLRAAEEAQAARSATRAE